MHAAAGRLDALHEPVGDHLAAALRVVGAAEVVAREAHVQERADLARRQPVVAALAEDHGLEPRIADQRVEHLPDRGVLVRAESQRGQRDARELAHAGAAPVGELERAPHAHHGVDERDVAIDAARLVREVIEQSTAVALEVRRDGELEVGKDELVEAVGVEAVVLELDAQLAQDARDAAVSLAVADVVEADVEVVAGLARAAGELRRASACRVVRLEDRDTFAARGELGAGDEPTEARADDGDVDTLGRLGVGAALGGVVGALGDGGGCAHDEPGSMRASSGGKARAAGCSRVDELRAR